MGTRTPPPFERFLAEHGATVMRFLVVAVGPAQAEDAYQETFLSALRPTRACGTTDGSTGGSCASPRERRSTTIAGAGGRPRRSRRSPTAPCTTPTRSTTGSATPCRRCRTKQRVAVVLRHVLDRPYDEIAEVLSCSEEAARANVSAGLKTLRERVG